MIISVISSNGESRVAVTPEIVKKLVNKNYEVRIEQNAGSLSMISDEEYAQAGAIVAKSAKDVLKSADIILTVKLPHVDSKDIWTANIPKGATLIALMNPYVNKDFLLALANQEVNLLALELIPRTTRAQSMDVLSSQANLAGYKAVIEAANAYSCIFPMIMTAAGTIAAARALVIGVGVAGLQAIATARRLGAVVSAFDVRSATKEQVESLGATFVEVDAGEVGDGDGGYAKEMSAEYKKKQAEKLTEALIKSDIVITTAQIPGKPAPMLVTKKMVESMHTRSVIVDLAVESGGNCELSKAGEKIVHKGVTIIGYGDMPGKIAHDASKLFARNVFSILQLLTKNNQIFIDTNDYIISASLLASGGKTTEVLNKI
ncbi:MAG: Re/Si-specific NAD(P)(+) transhydrogenase subunit alpha [Holosporales bacterium]|jgi:NAD(P) transhydrogenase subunit alpha|nr:Re/Si-specific NAD(P)(+) transhydrogenase subunit alpha [Holosporales bacterium]